MIAEEKLKAWMTANAAPRVDARFELAVLDAIARRRLRQELTVKIGWVLVGAALVTALVAASLAPDRQVMWAMLAGLGAVGMAVAAVRGHGLGEVAD